MAKLTAFIKTADVTPPVTTDDHLTVSPITPCTVTLTPTDAGSGMVGGFAKTEYKVDGAGSYSVGTAVVMTTGEHTVLYRSTDRAGNLETPDKTFDITVVGAAADTTPPVTTDDSDSVSLESPCTVTLTPTDAESGMSGGAAKTEYKVDASGTTVKTVGNQVAEAMPSRDWADYKYLDAVTMTETGDVSKLTGYFENNSTGHAACNVKALIYSDNASEPDALLATGSAVAFADNAALAWVDLPFSSDVTLAAGTYWIGFIGDATANGLVLRVRSGAGSSGYNVDTYVGGAADPAGTLEHDNNLAAIYATYSIGVEGYNVGTSVVMTTGEHTVLYRSTDADGNMETPDRTSPSRSSPPCSLRRTSRCPWLMPPSARSIVITGSGFGANQGTSTVTFGERPNSEGWASCARTATVTAWADDEITCTVPSMSPGKAATPNTYHPVYVTVGGVADRVGRLLHRPR